MTRKKEKSTTHPDARVAELVQAIHAADAELQRITGGHLDAVDTPGRQPYLLRAAQQQLRVETRRLHESQAVANVGSWETNLTTLEVTWTPETYRIFEVSPGDFQPSHQRFLAMVHPDDRAKVDATFASSLGRPGAFAIEHRICLPEGRIKFVEERWQNFNDETGQPNRAVGTCQDITFRKLSDQALQMRARQQEAIAKIGFETTRAMTLEGLFDLTTRVVAEALDVELCKVLQLTPDGSHLRLVSGVGWQPGLVGVAMVGVDEASQAGFTLKSAGPIFVNDLGKEQRFQAPPLLTQHDVVSGLSVTIPLLDKPWGVLGAHCRVVREFDQHDAQFMHSVAALLSVVVERLAAQRSLTESERRMRDAQRIAQLGNWELEIASNLVNLSEEVYRIYGLTPDDDAITYEACRALIHPEDVERIDAAHRRALAGDGVVEIEHRLIRPNGEIRHVRERGELIHDEQGHPVALTGTILDITARATLEAERDRMFNLSVDLLSVGNFEGRLEQVNPAWTRCLGWSAEELTSRPWLDFVHPDDHEVTRAAGAALVRGERLEEFENRYRSKDGSYRWLSWNSHPLVETRQIFGVCRDVTERRIATEQSKQREELLRIAGNIAQLGGWTVELPDVAITWSDEVCAIHEMPRGTVPTLEQGLGFYTPASRAIIEPAFAACVRDGTPFDLELEIVTAQGQTREVRATGVALIQPNGTIYRVQGALQDITEQKLTRQKLQQGQSLLRIAGAIAKVGGWAISIPGNALYWSDEIFDILDYPQGPVPTLDQALELYPEPWRSQLGEAIMLCATQGIPFELDLTIKSAQGRLFWARCKAEAGRDESGQIFQVRGAFQDISAEREAEAKAATLGDRLVDTLEAISDAFVTLDRDWRFTYLNGKAEQLIQRKRADLIGKNVWEEFPDLIDSEFYEAYYLARETQRTVSLVAFSRSDNKWFDVRAHPSAEGLAVYYRDVSEAKHAEEALRESAGQLRQNQTMLSIAGRAAKLGGWSIDLPDQKLTWSDETAIIHDLPPGTTPSLEEAIAFYPPEYRDPVSEYVRLLATDGIPFDFEHELITARQRRIWVRAIGEAQRDDAGQIGRLYGAFQDITERKIADLALLASNRALQLLSRCNEALVRSDSEANLLHEICRIAVEIGGFAMAWVGYAQDNREKTIEPQAFAGDEGGYLSTLQVSWSDDDPSRRAPAGQVIRSGEPMVIPDLSEEPSFAPWLAAAQAHGYAGVVVLPLKNQSRTFGVLVLYADQVRTPHEDELRVLGELADDLAFGIGNLRSQAERRRLEAALVRVAASVSVNLGADFFSELAASAAEAMAADGAFVARLLPGEPAVARTVAAVLDGRVVENFDYPLHGTPCEKLMDSDECVVPAEAAQHFPDSPRLTAAGAQAYVGRRLISAGGQTLGLIYVLFRKPLTDSRFVVSTLQIFAARAAGEFERLAADTRIRAQAALLDEATDAIFVRDLEHRVVFWSRGAEKLYGWSAADALGRPTPEFLYPNSGLFHSAVAAVMDKGAWTGELEKQNQAGKLVIAECRWTLLRDGSGVPESILCIETDITERRKLQAQFLRAQRMESVGTLASGIAHDMNNILAPILMSVELLREDAKDAATLEMLKTLEVSSQRGADLVRQLLSFARGLEGQEVAVNLTHLTTELQKVMKEVFPKDVQFEVSASRDLWTIVGDPSQLHQVMLNLCVNARDAMPRGGKLAISIENVVLDEVYEVMNPDARTGAYVMVSVADTGTGIPATVLDKIFEPFFTTKELGKGTGLGLSTVIGIVKNHGGFVNVYSEEGKGTQFKVYFPAQTSDAQVEEALVTQTGIPRGNGELILLVDDEKGIREIAVKTLVRFGYRVVEAANGAEAVAYYVQHQKEIALVLTDVSMPIMDGAALVTALRAVNPDVLILVSSGLPTNSGVAKAMDAGVRNFIPKPYTAEKLLGIIHRELHS